MLTKSCSWIVFFLVIIKLVEKVGSKYQLILKQSLKDVQKKLPTMSPDELSSHLQVESPSFTGKVIANVCKIFAALKVWMYVCL